MYTYLVITCTVCTELRSAVAVAQYLKPAVLLTCRRTKLAMQHSIATNVIRSFTFGTAVVKHLKQVIMLKKSLNIIRASNCNHPSKRLKIGHVHNAVILLL